MTAYAFPDDIDDMPGAPEPTVNGLVGAMQTFGRAYTVPQQVVQARNKPNYLATYTMLRTLAANNGAYAGLTDVLAGMGIDIKLHGMRNPINAACAFYRNTTWPGTVREDDASSALPLQFPDDNRYQQGQRKALHTIMSASNWNNLKDQCAYDAALLGDQLFKAVSDRDRKRVWFEVIQPEVLTDLEVDGRGYLIWVRFDVPMVDRDRNGSERTYWHTTIWDKGTNTRSIWPRNENGPAATLEQLGPAKREDVAKITERVGDDYIPVVHWKFRSNTSPGNKRGESLIMPALDKIILMDADATTLHNRANLYGIADMVLTNNAVGRDGALTGQATGAAPQTITAGKAKFFELQPGQQLDWLAANLQYESHLKLIEAHAVALVQTDLPELTYYQIGEASRNDSGYALEVRMTAATTNATLARGTGESELLRMLMMCLSIGQEIGAEGFSEDEIGTFANGDFRFWFADRPVLPTTPLQDIAVKQAKATLLKTYTDAGMGIVQAATLAGYSKDEVEELKRGDFEQPFTAPDDNPLPLGDAGDGRDSAGTLRDAA